jgi:hypothetical protein
MSDDRFAAFIAEYMIATLLERRPGVDQPRAARQHPPPEPANPTLAQSDRLARVRAAAAGTSSHSASASAGTGRPNQ